MREIDLAVSIITAESERVQIILSNEIDHVLLNLDNSFYDARVLQFRRKECVGIVPLNTGHEITEVNNAFHGFIFN